MYDDEKIIRQLINRYMEGTTSIEEEAQISDWFKKHPKVDEDLQDYQLMFTLLDTERIKNIPVERVVAPKRVKLRYWWVSLTVAASLVVAFFAFHPDSFRQDATKIASETSSITSAGQNTMAADTIKQQQKEESLHQKNEKEKSLQEKTKYRQHRFSPAPPKNSLASVDVGYQNPSDILADLALENLENLEDDLINELLQENQVTAQLALEQSEE